MGVQTWFRVTITTVSITEYTFNEIREEASYQFRISAVNDFGQSAYLEIPGTFYLGKKDIFMLWYILYLNIGFLEYYEY